MSLHRIHLGTAGWSIRKEYDADYPASGSHLERYAQTLSAVEINSSFYRPHRQSTYARWAASVPEDFRFAVKVPRALTHLGQLSDTSILDRFLDETAGLGLKLGPLLVQLPPRFAYNDRVMGDFFTALRERFAGDVVCEPRHRTWFTAAADALLNRFRVARVAADPALMPQAAQPGGWPDLAYYRLHGSPRIYYSAYPDAYLEKLTGELMRQSKTSPVWCIFDNTAEGAATHDALRVWRSIGTKTLHVP
jgi:uncharacterized protein YecE (DUF72 family)